MISPMQTAGQVELLGNLERQLLLVQSPFLTGHRRFRSAYFPSHHVVDGDLCEAFFTHIDQSTRAILAQSLSVSIATLYGFLESMRPSVTSPFLL